MPPSAVRAATREKSRAKERVFSFRNEYQQWDPKNQRPELWDIYNTRINDGESIRVFPLSNWTELDVWQYIRLEKIPIVPLYFAKERPVVEYNGNLIMVDDDRMPEELLRTARMRKVRFRTLGCYPLTGAIESEADTIEKDRRGDDDHDKERAHHACHRLRSGWQHGTEETRRLFLTCDQLNEKRDGINIEEFLAQDERKDLLRLLTAGSVDDGKSTLIGRLLFDSKRLYEDQLQALERDSKRCGNAGDHIDYALLCDGLKAEREQGITIDVAYRYFSTNRRKFIIADTPDTSSTRVT